MHICQQYFSARSILWWTGKYIVPFISSVPLLTYRHASLFLEISFYSLIPTIFDVLIYLAALRKIAADITLQSGKNVKWIVLYLLERRYVWLINQTSSETFSSSILSLPLIKTTILLCIYQDICSRYLLKSSSSRRGYWAFLPVHFCFYLFAFCFFSPTIQFLNCFLPILNLFVVYNRFLPLL